MLDSKVETWNHFWWGSCLKCQNRQVYLGGLFGIGQQRSDKIVHNMAFWWTYIEFFVPMAHSKSVCSCNHDVCLYFRGFSQLNWMYFCWTIRTPWWGKSMPQKEIPSCSRCFSLTCWCLLRWGRMKPSRFSFEVVLRKLLPCELVDFHRWWSSCQRDCTPKGSLVGESPCFSGKSCLVKYDTSPRSFVIKKMSLSSIFRGAKSIFTQQHPKTDARYWSRSWANFWTVWVVSVMNIWWWNILNTRKAAWLYSFVSTFEDVKASEVRVW